ncbi:MAG: MBL fold metallo-hydrolase [Candidatus Gastranaerophilales bacterium]|nr:MBL fold metallo-hydrolase [Candidatus Gastranaerophilales bacterium]
MEIKTFVEGPIDANNYHIIDEKSKEAVLIDCSSARPEFINAIKNSGVNLKYILLTHGHFDHLLGIDAFKDSFGVETYVAQDDLTQVRLVPDMMQMFLGIAPVQISEITHFIKDGDEFKIGDTVIKAIATPGHTKGGMCYLVEGNLFSGDTLFQGSVGRCDLLDGDLNAIVKSIKEKLFILPDDIKVYPGHGAASTIGYEKNYNEILNI